MSDPTQQCPSVWQEITTPHRVCGRRSISTGGCEGLTYSAGSEQCDQVCGRIIGYQLGNTDSFLSSSRSIDTYYVDGISVTHGSPCQHIWTFSNGLDELSATYPYVTCPCVTGSTNGNCIPSFVGQNFFCETGITLWSLSGNFMHIFFQMVTACGMDRGVVPLAPVVPSTHHHGSMYNYTRPPVTTLKSGSVIEAQLNQINKVILWYNLSNFMWNELHMTYMLIHQYISLNFM